jgi:hypothetical protein
MGMRRKLLLRPHAVSRLFGMQPQGDVGGLHRLSYHPEEIVA